MAKLKKRTKSFESSEETILVEIEGLNYEAANLLKSGIKHQKIVLLAVDEIWHEIDVTLLGAEEIPLEEDIANKKTLGSNLQDFKAFVEGFMLKLSDLGITKEKIKTDYELKHENYVELESEFPKFDYIKISILNSYLKESSQTTGMYAIRQILKMLTERNFTIKDYISNCNAQKEEIINNKNSKIIQMKSTEETPTVIEKNQTVMEETPTDLAFRKGNRIIELTSYGVVPSDSAEYFEGIGFTVTISSIEDDSDDDWNSLISRISAAAAAAAAGIYPLEVGEDNQTAIPEVISAEILPFTVTQNPVIKKPVSLETISNLSPDRITELQGLKELQNKIVSENPFIKITDSKTLKKAKETEAVLLKASTAIDGTKGILTTFVTHANQFIKMGKDFLNPLAQITREAYDKQKLERVNYENAEAIKIQAAQKAALEKVNNRTSRLFSIPMVFNGEIYSIGSLFVLPSQIEKATDEEFESIVSQGIAIKNSLEAVESEKDKRIRDLEQKLAALGMIEKMDNTTEIPQSSGPEVLEDNSPNLPLAPPIDNTPISIPNHVPAPTVQAPTSANNAISNGRFKPSEIFIESASNNKILSNFDLEHLEFISANPMMLGFIKSRGYFIEGTKKTALEIKNILLNPDQSVKKSVAIAELCEILLNS